MNQNIATEDAKSQIDKKPSPKRISLADLPLRGIASFVLFMVSPLIIFLKFQNQGHYRKNSSLNKDWRIKWA
jgi:hypothetical protein